MILPDLVLKSRVNVQCNETGLDSYNQCPDQDHFKNFPHAVEYHYNSRGFRDSEWPSDPKDLKSAIWCVGDSFTVGLGSPFSHTWPQVLQKNTESRVINVSMDGASNNWIARRILDIHNAIAPEIIVVMWSYFHRREAAVDGSDEEKRLHFTEANERFDLLNFIKCFTDVNRLQNVNLIHFLIPLAYPNDNAKDKLLINLWNNIKGPTWPQRPPKNFQELENLPEFIINQLKHVFCVYQELHNILGSFVDYSCISSIHHVQQLDWARDKHHFDIFTSRWVARQVMSELKL
jgi:hypothetical protein